jgi:hypothetical protein
MYEFSEVEPGRLTNQRRILGSSVTVPGSNGSNYSLQFSPDGLTLYRSTGSTIQWTSLTIPWLPESGNGVWQSLTAANLGISALNRFYIANNGSALYTTTFSTSATVIYKHTLTTAWDLTSNAGTPDDSFTFPFGYNADLYVSNDERHVYVDDYQNNDRLYHYIMDTPGDLSTMREEEVRTGFVGTYAYTFNPDGTQLVRINLNSGTSGNDATVYELEQPWRISVSTTFTIDFAENYYASIYFSSNGKFFYAARTSTGGGRIMRLDFQSYGSTINWPSNLTWESGSAPELPELTKSKVFDIYTKDGGTTYFGVEKMSSAYNPSKLIE